MWPRWKSDLAWVAFLFAAACKTVLNIENGQDVGLFDECIYLGAGLHVSDGLPGPSQSPLYALWYALLSLFEMDPIGLYYLNARVLITITPILLYVLLVRHGASRAIAFAASWLLLVSFLNYHVLPRVCHFAALLTICILLTLRPGASIRRSGPSAILGGLLLSYTRPEYFYAFLIATVVFGSIAVVDWTTRRDVRALPVFFSIAACTLALWAFGSPIAGQRSALAFGQHFAVHWVKWNDSGLNPWLDWSEIVTRNFGKARGIGGSFIANPTMFLIHVGQNLRDLPNASELVLPPLAPDNRIAKIVFWGLAGVALLFVMRKAKSAFRVSMSYFVLSGIYIFPGALSSVIIYPRDHYFFVPFVLALGLFAMVASEWRRSFTRLRWRSLYSLAAGAILLFLTPSPYLTKEFPRPNYDTLERLQALPTVSPVNVLAAEGGLDTYLGENFHSVAATEKETGFDEFLANRHIDIIVVTEGLKHDVRFVSDPEWWAFLTDLNAHGFERIRIPNHPRHLAVRAQLAGPGAATSNPER